MEEESSRPSLSLHPSKEEEEKDESFEEESMEDEDRVTLLPRLLEKRKYTKITPQKAKRVRVGYIRFTPKTKKILRRATEESLNPKLQLPRMLFSSSSCVRQQSSSSDDSPPHPEAQDVTAEGTEN